MKVEFYKHNIGSAEIELLQSTLGSIFLTTGPKTAQFEKLFASYLNCEYAVGVSSWTSGAFLVLKAWGIGPGDEVITTPMTFVATSNIIVQVGAKPVFVDVEPATGNMNLDLLEAAITPRTKAIIPVHLYGQMVDMKRLRKIADQHGLKILEDCAHCIEGTRDGVKPGQMGDAAAFSFYATKNITCGDGGAIVTNDPVLYEDLARLRLHGLNKSAADRYTGIYQHWDMEIMGYKANMTDISASLLIPQLNKIEQYRDAKESICQRYEQAFASLPNVDFPEVLKGSKSARHIATVWVPAERRDVVLNRLQTQSIGVAVNFRAIHLLKYYRENFGFKRGDFPVAESIGDRTITLPLYPRLTEAEIDHVIGTFKQAILQD